MYDNMTTEQLEAQLQKLNDQRAALKIEAMKVQAMLDARAVQAELDRSLSNMSDSAKAALARLGVPSIPSSAAFGIPGRG